MLVLFFRVWFCLHQSSELGINLCVRVSGYLRHCDFFSNFIFFGLEEGKCDGVKSLSAIKKIWQACEGQLCVLIPFFYQLRNVSYPRHTVKNSFLHILNSWGTLWFILTLTRRKRIPQETGNDHMPYLGAIGLKCLACFLFPLALKLLWSD